MAATGCMGFGRFAPTIKQHGRYCGTRRKRTLFARRSFSRAATKPISVLRPRTQGKKSLSASTWPSRKVSAQADDTGIGDVVGGQEAFIAISNTGGTPFTAGLAQALSGTDKVVPFYAEPLYGHQTNFAQPTSKILLVLSTQVLAPGTVIDKLPLVSATMATAHIRTAQTIQGILIDTASERTVEFDINGGWKWNGGVWASLVSVNAGLIGALIEKLS